MLILVAFFTYGNAPALGASAAEKAAFFTDHRGRILTAMVLAAFALLLFVWFSATLAATLREAGEQRLADVVVSGSALFAAVISAFMVVAAGLASSIAKGADQGLTAALFDLSLAAQVLVSFPAALLAAAVGIATRRSTVFPAWWAWASGAGAIVFLSAGTTWASSGFWALDGGWSMISFFAFLAWTVVTSGLLVAHHAPAGASAGRAPIGAH